MEEKKARIEYLEDKLSMVSELIKFIEAENDHLTFRHLMDNVNEYRMLIKMKMELFCEIKKTYLQLQPQL